MTPSGSERNERKSNLFDTLFSSCTSDIVRIVQSVDYRETRAPVIKEAANDVIKQSNTRTCVCLCSSFHPNYSDRSP